MKNKRRLMLFLLMPVLLAMLVGCGGETGELPADGTEAAEQIYLIADGKSEYVLVRPENCSRKLLDAIMTLKASVLEKTGCEIRITTDWLIPGTTAPEKEILIGACDREEVAALDIGYDDYTIRMSGTKLVVSGGNETLTLKAIEAFTELLDGGGLVLEAGFNETVGKQHPMQSISIGGRDIGEYTVVYSSEQGAAEAAEVLFDKVGNLCGTRITLGGSSTPVSDYEIVVGTVTGRPEQEKLQDDSFSVSVSGTRILLNGGNSYALANAAAYLADEYFSAPSGSRDTALADISFSYSLPDRQEYIDDITKFYPRWSYQWTPPEEMLDFEGKVAALCDPNTTRLLTNAHRADFVYYPENTVEAILSVYLMGGDVVELDVQYTKDGVAVLNHDDTLNRATNAGQFVGRSVDGVNFPNSYKVSDWTYEQIMCLNLKTGFNGSGELTPFRMATLEEALTVCRNRLFIVLDKTAGWRYCDIDGIMTESEPNFIYPLMERTGNYTSCLISYGGLNAEQALKIQQYIYEKSGQAPYILLRGSVNNNTAVAYAEQLRDSLTNNGILLNGAYIFQTSKARNLAAMRSLKGLSFLCGWTTDDAQDREEVWDEMVESGFRMIMTNRMLDLVQYAAQLQ